MDERKIIISCDQDMEDCLPVDTTTISVTCDDCSMCCNRNSIYLTSMDVFRLGMHTGLSSIEFVTEYCVIGDDKDDRFPVLFLKKDKNGRCPFAVANEDKPGYKCSLPDKSKPSQCLCKHLFFLTRMTKNDELEVFMLKVPRRVICANKLCNKTMELDVQAEFERFKKERYVDLVTDAKLFSAQIDMQDDYELAMKLERCITIIAQLSDGKNGSIKKLLELDIVNSLNIGILQATYDYDGFDTIEDITEESINERVEKLRSQMDIVDTFKKHDMDSYIIDNFVKVFGISVETCLENNIHTISEMIMYIKENGVEDENSTSGLVNEMFRTGKLTKDSSPKDIQNAIKEMQHKTNDFLTKPPSFAEDEDDEDDGRNALRD